jgi:dissimilatory sulfite reductase beta subunit
MRQPIESGCPDGFQYMHPVMRKNFGSGNTMMIRVPACCGTLPTAGDKIWTVKAGTQRILDIFTLRKLCDIGDKFADGYIRFHHAQQHRVHGHRRSQG